jgi:hypothetical protein
VQLECGLVLRIGQCDKENQGWREGPPLPSPARFGSVEGLHPPGISVSNERRILPSKADRKPYSLLTLAGIKPYLDRQKCKRLLF